MNLASRIGRLEEILKPKVGKVHFFGWKDCEWKMAEGLVRYENESKQDFFKRVKAKTEKKWVWCC